jgi:hypothetical protein
MKPEERRRNRIQVGFTDAETAALEAMARKQDIPIAALIRELVLKALKRR